MLEKKIFNNLKLTIELVPETSWFNNLRYILPPESWKKIRQFSKSYYNNSCAICKSKETLLDCHEIWEYDDIRHIQTLKGFLSLCKKCHLVKHFGFAQILAEQGKIKIENIINHFLKVNNYTYNEFEAYADFCFLQWQERSKYNWQLKIDLKPEFKELESLIEINYDKNR